MRIPVITPERKVDLRQDSEKKPLSERDARRIFCETGHLKPGFLENTRFPKAASWPLAGAGQKRPVSPKSSPFRSTLEITRSSENKRPGPAELPRMQENGNPLA
jgi:hypothetical protein